MSNIQVSQVHDDDAARAAAAIWAGATARRDQEPEPATVEEALPGIRRRLDLEDAVLFLAHEDGNPVGFALVAPHPHSLELFYLGVDPAAWGKGVAQDLLNVVAGHAQAIGRDTIELWVINDNVRAIGVYQRAGWSATDELKPNAAGRLERRFLNRIGGPAEQIS